LANLNNALFLLCLECVGGQGSAPAPLGELTMQKPHLPQRLWRLVSSVYPPIFLATHHWEQGRQLPIDYAVCSCVQHVLAVQSHLSPITL